MFCIRSCLRYESVSTCAFITPSFGLVSSQTPALVCSEAFSAFLYKHCPVVAERFSPTPWCWGGRLQTLVCAILKSRPPVSYRNELIRTVDGGQISLDWVDNQASVTYPDSSTRPTVLILPGITGNSQQSYVLHAVSQAARHGYSMVLLNYLARKRAESGMVAGITISVPWDAHKSCYSMEEPLNWLLFNKHITRCLHRAVTRHRKILEKVVDVDYVLKARSIREFDERFTSLVFGYKSCTDYYHDASPDKKLPSTAVPILCLNAADDPFSPQNAFPVNIVQELPNVALVLTAHGGHIAFLQGLFPRGESYMERLFGQFVHAVFEHPKEIERACGIEDEQMKN
uniref:Abhydrolase domain containing 1 n=1 Tax=Amphilophus citrinellus TaxID=61819 RepID=A0A3Q0R8K0_AMPCI